MKKLYIFIFVLIVAVIAVITLVGLGTTKEGPVACTMEAKVCPDGSAVGRTGPNCEFAECPPVLTSSVPTSNDLVLGISETGQAGDVSITVKKLTEDSRCPQGVQCMWAGAFRVEVALASASNKETTTITLGESAHFFDGRSISITSATPFPKNGVRITENDYAITFHLVTNVVSYVNASSDLIKVSSPLPGASVKKSFSISGEARGTYFFEASFPVTILGAGDEVLVQTYATAKGDWMTENLVPFSVDITLPGAYSGPAKIILKKDNPSGLPEHDASTSFDIVVE
ncbi:MAG: Gmad2 immunoglobulin-like domain-containing protein [Candidatus Pacebacteria bacterium]|jgi:hypothetical protein|nr:Gmad2 immunoglobulin-like domain-containing protein [Candidatus Paceibacterota bacterium]